MNRANGMVCERTAVDPINSLLLLLQIEAKRYAEHRDRAWDWSEDLTPHGKKLLVTSFEKGNVCDYEILIEPGGDRYCCHVNCLTLSNKYICYIPMVNLWCTQG
jgi:hypothetical protein